MPTILLFTMSQNISNHKYYDSISKGYDELYKEEQLKKIKIMKEIIVDNIININKNNKNKINNKNIINNKIKKIDDKNNKTNNNKKINNNKNNIDDYKILDVGCGPGFSEIINRNIVGIDPSIELLKKARIKRVNGVAESLPFKDKVFDIVISITAVHNFNNINKAIKDMKRVCNDNGYFIISILKKSRKFNLIKNIIKNNFKIKDIIKEEKDTIFFCEGYC